MVIVTLGGVRKYVNAVVVYMEFFGAAGKFRKGFNNFCRAMGKIIAEEQCVKMEEAQNLPEYTELGDAAQLKFLRLQLWVLKNK